ncbi:MAG TPA: MarR family winged helix-turn-helix transcriptional regulator [Streptosporangiaceae bacterium]|jgi:DNA-binding MarR family transcriptional regulator
MRTHVADDAELRLGGPALFQIIRFWSRRWAAGAASEAAGDAQHVGHVLILEAIAAAAGSGPAASSDASGASFERPAAIGDVAVELGLDRSNASRMLAAAVVAGLVTKETSAADARRTELRMTPAGQALLAAARAWQEETFLELTASWPAADVRRFAAYLHRLAAQSLTLGSGGESR